jgi:beta-galactosidase
MIERDRSHPSVITWMLADESVCGKNFLEVLKFTRASDPSRPVHIAYDPESGVELLGLDRVQSPFDLASWHYPNAGHCENAAASKRPVLFDQSVHVYCGDVSEVMTDPALRDDWGRQYAVFWEKVWATRSIFGAQVFNFEDDVFLMPSGQVLGYGDWGLIDYWRRAKPDLWHVKKAHTPIKIQDGPIPSPDAGQPLEIPVENRYDFTNLSDVRIEWSLGNESGTVQASVPPHGKGMITVRPGTADLNGKTLSLKFFRKGLMVDAYRLPVGKAAEPAPLVPPVADGNAELLETKETFAARGRAFEWVISRNTGQIIQAAWKGKPILVGGPVLMILPTKEELYTSGYPGPRPVAAPFNATCSEWKATSVSANNSAGVIEIKVAGQYREAAGSYVLRIGGDGSATISYQFVYTCPEKIDPRQIGIVFHLSRSHDTLSWKRNAQWSVYPEDHIGRAEGVARALRDQGAPEVAYREKPAWPWFLDSNELGTRDFRATRRNILHASLKDSAGHGITVWSDGTQHTRCFLDGDRVGLLVAYHSGPGRFWGIRGLCEIAKAENTPLEKGAELKDTVRLSLVGG